jgi:hypothetical protein
MYLCFAIVSFSNGGFSMSHSLVSRLVVPSCFAVICIGCGGQGLSTSDDDPAIAKTGEALTLVDHITGIHATFDSVGNLTEDGQTYPAVYKGTPRPAWVHIPWLSPSQIDPLTGYHAIGFRLDPTGTPLASENSYNDKANLTLAYFPTNVDIWEGFSMIFSQFGQPNVDLILAQWWQGGDAGPPVSLVEKGKGNFECDIHVRNNQTGGNPSAPTHVLPLGTCRNDGLWHTFLFHIRAGYSNDGIVEVWKDTVVGPPTAAYAGNVGYDPNQCVSVNGTGACQGGNANAKLMAFYGPYRPLDSVQEQMFFANIKFAYDRQSADPTTR